MVTKAELRARLTAARESLRAEDVASLSDRVLRRVLGLRELEPAGIIFTYVSTGNEVGTLKLIEAWIAAGKTVCVPRIRGDGLMEAHRIEGLDDLVPGRYGIPAPREPRPLDRAPDACVCPGAAFTPEGDRLGRGKGYYDRYLEANPETLSVGLCYELQIVESLPTSPLDRAVDLVVTEERVIRPARGRAKDEEASWDRT